MKYVKIRNGNIYKVIYESGGNSLCRFVCSDLELYDVVKRGDEEKCIESGKALVFIHKAYVEKEASTLEELCDAKADTIEDE